MGCRNGKPVLNEEDKKLLSETSGLTVDQVEERFQAFLKDHPDGKMKKKDFRCMISQVRCSKSLYLYLVICEVKDFFILCLYVLYLSLFSIYSLTI